MKKVEFQVVFHGPACEHNYLCAVCQRNSAVYDMGAEILQPCWECQEKGYEVRCRGKKIRGDE